MLFGSVWPNVERDLMKKPSNAGHASGSCVGNYRRSRRSERPKLGTFLGLFLFRYNTCSFHVPGARPRFGQVSRLSYSLGNGARTPYLSR